MAAMNWMAWLPRLPMGLMWITGTVSLMGALPRVGAGPGGRRRIRVAFLASDTTLGWMAWWEGVHEIGGVPDRSQRGARHPGVDGVPCAGRVRYADHFRQWQRGWDRGADPGGRAALRYSIPSLGEQVEG